MLRSFGPSHVPQGLFLPRPGGRVSSGASPTCRTSNIWTMDEGGWDRASSSKSPSFTLSRTRSRKPSREIWRMVSSWPWRGERGQGWEVRAHWICHQKHGVQDNQSGQNTRMGEDEVSAELGEGGGLPKSRRLGPCPSQGKLRLRQGVTRPA